MNPDIWIAVLAALALAVDIVIHLVGGTYLLSKSRESLAVQLADKIEERRQAVDLEFSSFRGELGETFAAMRQAISDVGKEVNRVELEAYKSFIRRESFYEVMNRQQDVVTVRLDKMDTKMEQNNRDVGQRISELGNKLDQAIRETSRNPS